VRITDLLKKSVQILKKTSDTPQLDAEILLCDILKLSRSELFLNSSTIISQEVCEEFQDCLDRRLKNEPVAYILKKKDFYKDSFYVDRRVLVPRPETEIVVEEAVKLLKNRRYSKVLDICTGSGCLGLSIKRDTNCDLTLSDISKDALGVTRINAEKLFPGKEIKVVQSDLFNSINDSFDLITANPPYLSESDMEKFCRNELKYEPEEALLSGKTGFEVTGKIVEQAPDYLNDDGVLMLELGYEGSHFLKDTKRLSLEKVVKDLAGVERVAVFTLRR
jgi:release factor glutamine methyltransferase